MITYGIKYKQGMPFYPVTFPWNEADGLVIEDLRLQELVDYINSHGIKSAFIDYMKSYEFLKQCGGLEHVDIQIEVPPRYYSELKMKGKYLIKTYDLEPLYSLKNLKGLALGDGEETFVISEIKVDLSRFSKLEKYSGVAKYVENLGHAEQLKTLNLYGYEEESLKALSNLKQLDTLMFTASKITTLTGCEDLEKLQCLYLYYNRRLSDISALRHVKRSLKALRIENCAKIQDFSPIEELEELELLELCGSNKIPSLSFIKKMKKLKTFVFSVEVLDGDLTPCLDLKYVYCDKVRKYYNLRNKDFPHGEYVRGNESIEMWRRFE